MNIIQMLNLLIKTGWRINIISRLMIDKIQQLKIHFDVWIESLYDFLIFELWMFLNGAYNILQTKSSFFLP